MEQTDKSRDKIREDNVDKEVIGRNDQAVMAPVIIDSRSAIKSGPNCQLRMLGC